MMNSGARILVADDDELIVVLLRRSLEAAGYVILVAEDGETALSLAATEHPDLVLIDKNMPGVGGVEVMQQLKAASGAGWTPVIMLSGDASQQSQIEALKLGCDDYLTKPVNLFVLAEKIAAFLRVQELHRMVSRQKTELQSYRDHAEEEASITRFLLGRLMGEDGESDPNVGCWIQPSTTFSGDLVSYARAPSGELYAMLADATGHGLPAAVTLVPMTRIFHSMAVRGFHLRTIAQELNRLVYEFTPADRFVAVTLACISPRESTLMLVNAGNPAALLFTQDGLHLRDFRSKSIALGILDGAAFDPQVENVSFGAGDLLVLYSDGLIEARGVDGWMMKRESIGPVLADRGDLSPLAAIRQDFLAHMGGQPAHDDVSLLVVECPTWTVQIPAPSETQDVESNWRLEFELGFLQLRALDVVPSIVNGARSMGLSARTCARLHTVLTELYANALDHGLLHLDSSLKETENGFELFMLERQKRLQSLMQGEVLIRLVHRSERILQLYLRDSGTGFMYNTQAAGGEPALSGRGLALVYSLCQSVHYLGCGNEVEVELRCD